MTYHRTGNLKRSNDSFKHCQMVRQIILPEALLPKCSVLQGLKSIRVDANRTAWSLPSDANCKDRRGCCCPDKRIVLAGPGNSREGSEAPALGGSARMDLERLSEGAKNLLVSTAGIELCSCICSCIAVLLRSLIGQNCFFKKQQQQQQQAPGSEVRRVQRYRYRYCS
eukprot:SAG31_NODE_235_length_19695_cov_37.959790_6_plen_168_part_00